LVVALCLVRSSASASEGTLILAVRLVDGGVRMLGDPASDPRNVLQRIADAMPSAEGRVRDEVRAAIQGIPPPGAEFRCSGEFVRSRTRKALLRIRDTLLNVRPDAVEPAVCYAAPFAIDRAQLRALHLDIFGYDLDTVVPQIVVVTRDGHRDVTSALATRSHYHLVLSLSEESLPPDALSIGVSWGHLIRYSIPIIGATTPLCTSRIETIPATVVSNAPAHASVPETSAAVRTTVWADVALDYANNKVEATVCMTSDRLDDETLISGCTVEFLYTTDPDSVIDGILGRLRSDIEIKPTGRAVVERRSRSGPVRRWRLFGSRPGVVDAVRADLGPIRVVSTRDENCLAPLAYVEARRSAVLTAATRRRLDPQLTHVDPAILTLRLRFAPP